MLELLKNKNIMIVVAHPDDEVIGIGGTINWLSSNLSCNIRVVILGEGITSRDLYRDESAREEDLIKHQENIKRAQSFLGYDSLSTYNFPDNRFDTVPLLDIVKVVESEKNLHHPEFIFTHHGGDLNIDHQITFDSVMTAFRPLAGEVVESILTFETFSGTEWRASTDPEHFVPSFYCEIEKKNLDAKINAMQAYEFEKRNFPHPRSPEALTIYSKSRGLNVGVKYAEAFNIVRMINFVE